MRPLCLIYNSLYQEQSSSISRTAYLVKSALNVELRMLGLTMLQLDGNILIVGEISGKVDFTKGAATELPSQLETASNSDIHFTCE